MILNVSGGRYATFLDRSRNFHLPLLVLAIILRLAQLLNDTLTPVSAETTLLPPLEPET